MNAPVSVEVTSTGPVTVESDTTTIEVAPNVSGSIELNASAEIGPAGPGVPVGGDEGQVLAKASGDDYDTEWIDPTGGPGGGVTQEYVDDGDAATLAAANTHADDGDATIAAALLVEQELRADEDAQNTAAVGIVADDLTTETTARIAADAAEASARATLTTNLATEVTNRSAGDTAAIATAAADATSKVAAEATARGTAVSGAITTAAADATAKVAAEATARDTAIGVETSARTAADALLVPKTTTVNGSALSGNITVTATPTAGTVVDASIATTLSPSKVTGSAVVQARSIATTAPLTGGGDLTGDRTLTISAATSGAAGSMSAADKAKLDAISGTNTGDQTLASLGGASQTSRFAGAAHPTTWSGTAAAQTVNRSYFYGIGRIDNALTISSAWLEFTVVAAGNYWASIFRADTGARLATTGVIAIPGTPAIVNPSLTASVALPTGVDLIACVGSSLSSGVTFRGLLVAWFGTGAPFFGAQAAVSTDPTAVPANGTIQRAPGVIFT